MAWQTIENRVSPRKTIKSATVSLCSPPRGGPLRFNVTLRVDLCVLLGWKSKDCCGLQVGTDEDAGKFRIVRDAPVTVGKVRIGRYGVYKFNFGVVAALGEIQRKAAPCDAVKIDENTVELTLPDWNEDEAKEPPARVAAVPSSNPVAAPKVKQQSRPAPAKPEAKPKEKVQGEILVRNGICIDFTGDEESISFKDKTMDITARQAKFFGSLIAGMPNPIGREFLRRKLFPAAPNSVQSDVSLDMMAGDAKAVAKGLGLDLRTVKGIGFALVAP